MLLLKKRFIAAVLAGEKTQTIRLWKHRRMRAGQRSYIPGVGYIRILAVDAIALDELDEKDAAADGFASLAQLRAEIGALYEQQIAAGYQAWRVRFRLAPEETKRAATDPSPAAGETAR